MDYGLKIVSSKRFKPASFNSICYLWGDKKAIPRSKILTPQSFPMLRLLLTGGFSSVFVAWFLLLALRIPLMLHGLPLTQPELNWMLVGERIHRGFMLYTQTWDSLSPLSAGFYALADVVFGRSQVALQVMGLLAVMFQSAYFSYSLQRHNLYNDRTHLPAVLYALCASLFYDSYTLSPVLLGLTFLLVALNGFFAQFSKDGTDSEPFGIGFYVGVATLFHIPFGWFAGFAFVGLLLLSAVRLRKFLLLVFGFALPIIIVLLVFYLLNGYEAVYYNWIAVFLERDIQYYVDFQMLALVVLPMGLLLLLAATQLLRGNTRSVNFQIRCQQLMFFWLLTATASLFFAPDMAPYAFLVFVPPVAFFSTYFFLLVRKPWLGEVAFLTVLGCLAFNNWGRFYLPVAAPLWKDQRLTVAETGNTVSRKRLLIIGPGLDEYRNNTPATPYLHWRLARRHFENLDNYVTVIELYGNFQRDMPDVIIDKQAVVPVLFNRIPALANQYRKEGNVYRRK